MAQFKGIRTLTRKIRRYMVLVGMGAILLYFVLSTLMYISSYARIEGKDLIQDGNRVLEMIQSKTMDLQRIANHYGAWNQAYEKLGQEDTQWLRQNYSGWIPKEQGIELVAVVSKTGKLMDQSHVSESDFKSLMAVTEIRQALGGSFDHGQVFPHGLVYLNHQFYMMAVSPIQKMDRSGPSQGIVILGMRMDREQLLAVRANTHNELALVYDKTITASTLSRSDLNNNILKASMPENKQGKVAVFDQKSFVRMPLLDLSGQFIGSMVVTSDNASYRSVLFNMNLAGLAVVVGIMFVVYILSGSLAYSITKPLEQLRKQIIEMGDRRTLGKVVVNGTVEIVAIADAFNDMSDNFHKMVWENEQFKNNLIIDGLTGLYNQRYLYQHLGKLLQGSGKGFHVLLVDVDYFKKVNANFGHQSGDRVLQLIAEILRNVLGDKGIACRYAGEEFMLVVHDEGSTSCFNLSEQIRGQVHNSDQIRKVCGNIPVTVSMGLASYPDHGIDMTSLLENAEQALAMAKANGRNNSWLFNPEDNQVPVTQELQRVHRDAIMEALMQLVMVVDNKENYYTRHSEKVAHYAEAMGVILLKTERERYALYMAAILHDCGKITVPESIIEKAETLTFEEFQVVRMHPEMGCNLIQYSVDAPEILSGVRHHHERWDGKGYPDALEGLEIPLFARIICIADAYQSMTSDRPYRAAKTVDEAIVELKNSRGKQFDPELLDLFLTVIKEEIQIGSGTTGM